MKPLQVTEPHLPSLARFQELVGGIWERRWLTNLGPLVQELEKKLQAYHQVEFPIHCVVNGAIGLHLMIKAMGLKGEVITTPFSYVATTACPLWEGCDVVFADIDPVHLTLDPAAAEAAITPRTSAILATHVFGNPCDVEAFEMIGKKHGIPILYDAAHAFGVRYKGKSILEWGAASMVSTHATKLFHTTEGGFICSPDSALSTKLEWMRRFGHNGYDKFHGVGTNAKMTELHAAMGLAVLEEIDSIMQKRRQLVEQYEAGIAENSWVRPAFKVREGCDWNYSYYPVVCDSESDLLQVVARLNNAQIYPRRYFHPALNSVGELEQGWSGSCPIAENIAARIICLPLATAYQEGQIEAIVKNIKPD
jgi:dTDP-4-amino-4,6-dideoxygalactose transaminase